MARLVENRVAVRRYDRLVRAAESALVAMTVVVDAGLVPPGKMAGVTTFGNVRAELWGALHGKCDDAK